MGDINALFPGSMTLASDDDLVVKRWPTGVIPVDLAFDGGIPRGRYVELYGPYCVTPDTRVLTSDLAWVPAGDLTVGRGLVGFDETLNHGRGKNTKMRPAEVTRWGEARLDGVRIVTDRGEIRCSVGHGFVARHRTQKIREWRTAGAVLPGDSLLWTAEPWDELNSRDAGYVAGMMDGEGTMDSNSRLSFAQNIGPVLDETILALKRLGFDVSINPKPAPCVSARIVGGMWESMRLVGQVMPVRFLPKAQRMWVGRDLVSKGPYCTPGTATATVLAVEPLGLIDVVTMQTTSDTFIANGFPSHNSTLKSYVAYKALASVQQRGGRVALIDTEHSWDPEWGAELGVDPDNMMVGRPKTAEQCVTILEALIRQKYDLVVWDSIAATFPKQYAEAAPGSSHDEGPAALARVMSRGLARVTAANKHTSVIFVNQTRAKIGVTFGAKTATSGGLAMGFYASYRMSFVRTGKITEVVKQWDGEKMADVRRVLAHKISLTLEKSKLSAPNQEVYFVYNLALGEVDDVDFLVSQGIEHGLISKTAAGHHSIPDVLDKPIHGAAAFRAWVRANQEVVEWLKAEILPVSAWASPTT